MVLTPEQRSLIATAYEKAASDYMVLKPHREAFARKAEWFRMLARLGAKQKSVATRPAKQPQKVAPSASESPDTLGNPGMLSAARHLFAWQQQRR
jgi:hypothetical protein